MQSGLGSIQVQQMVPVTFLMCSIEILCLRMRRAVTHQDGVLAKHPGLCQGVYLVSVAGPPVVGRQGGLRRGDLKLRLRRCHRSATLWKGRLCWLCGEFELR